jgi:hypothetical protein
MLKTPLAKELEAWERNTRAKEQLQSIGTTAPSDKQNAPAAGGKGIGGKAINTSLWNKNMVSGASSASKGHGLSSADRAEMSDLFSGSKAVELFGNSATKMDAVGGLSGAGLGSAPAKGFRNATTDLMSTPGGAGTLTGTLKLETSETIQNHKCNIIHVAMTYSTCKDDDEQSNSIFSCVFFRSLRNCIFTCIRVFLDQFMKT